MSKANKGTREEQSSFSGSTDSRESQRVGLNGTFGFTNRPQEEFSIARAEDRAVLRIRLVIAVFLTVCTIGVACLVYFNTKRNEEKEFEEAMVDFSAKVFEAMGKALEQSLGALDAFVVSMVSTTAAANMTWPFVIVPNSSTKLAKLRGATKSTLLAIAPRVPAHLIDQWNSFSMKESEIWLENNLKTQKVDPGFQGVSVDEYIISPVFNTKGQVPTNHSEYYPSWQEYPSASLYPPFNFDLASIVATENIVRDKIAQISEVGNAPGKGEMYNIWLKTYIPESHDSTEPVSEMHYPILNGAAESMILDGKEEGLVGFMLAVFYWRDFMTNILPVGTDGLDVVVKNSCNDVFTYRIFGPRVEFQGFGDRHEPDFDQIQQTSALEALKDYSSGSSLYTGLPLSRLECSYTVTIFPSKEFERKYKSSNPWTYSAGAIAIFIFTSAVFAIYDTLVERRQKKVMSTAVKSSAIVSSLFPSNVRDRLYDQDDQGLMPNASNSQKNRLKSFITAIHSGSDGRENVSGVNRPIADLFPDTTVMFGDIEGFTAWSSTREPSQVFLLLESLYGAFDTLAAKRGVFKVETIGDSYVAVAGLPDPRPNHAVVMAKFAHACCTKMDSLMAKLAISLGPDTEELSMRFGLNSGPVTAGVLRGQKSRFQLFGDTVNTAARMESSGQKKRIHASESTADELRKHGKGHWIHVREDSIAVKGKGHMATCWVNPQESDNAFVAGEREMGHLAEEYDSLTRTNARSTSLSQNSTVPKIERLVDWNVDVLARLLHAIVARRLRRGVSSPSDEGTMESSASFRSQGLPIDDVREIITMPQFDSFPVNTEAEFSSLNPDIKSQLHEYVSAIAAIYQDSNYFHNFEHASHVCMSVAKLMSRIVATDTFFDQDSEECSIEAFKHEQTFGIASDPLTLFACAFAALIHDVDHPGVPNAQLVKEGTDIANKYNNRSVAEQWSVDVAWNLLMEDRFKDFRHHICPTQSELYRFRELVVNCVMATDIMDKDLKQLRNDRWGRAFDVAASASDDKATSMNRKATIVIEHLIQASDVAHTMQHWHVFRKWNERLFREMVEAYKAGRAEKDPAEFWYQGEIGFFDFYIIPLAKKLSSCGVFGVSSDEYLNYALKNREEWQQKGKQVVAEMVEALAVDLK